MAKWRNVPEPVLFKYAVLCRHSVLAYILRYIRYFSPTWSCSFASLTTNTHPAAYIIPFFILHRISLSFRVKIGVMAMFSIGLINIVLGILNIVFSLELGTSHAAYYGFYYTAIFQQFSAVLVVCMPYLRLLYRYLTTPSSGIQSLKHSTEHTPENESKESSSENLSGRDEPSRLEKGEENSSS